ncbi:MAG: hypothetical protein HKN23_16365 [Verrucomicrobiales bacterium]|nr:hypothetical protein [Verrucomicrobiales bacterium]
MSDSDSLEFSAKDLMPDWVQDLEKPSARKKQAGNRKERTDSRGEGRQSGQQKQERRGGGGDRRGFQGRGDQRGRGGGRDRKGGFRGGRDRNDRNRDRDRRPREDFPKDVEAVVRPTMNAVNALASHIRNTYRAYPLADVAKMVMGARDRYEVMFRRKQDSESGSEKKPFFLCKADQSVWLTKDEAVSHILRSENLNQFYQVEEVEVEPPKGAFNVVAVCGISGTILGPPNHHEYQKNIARLHASRFSDMPIERLKSRIEMSAEEEVIEKWKEQVSRILQYRVRGPDAENTESEGEPETGEDVESSQNELELAESTNEVTPQKEEAADDDSEVQAGSPDESAPDSAEESEVEASEEQPEPEIVAEESEDADDSNEPEPESEPQSDPEPEAESDSEPEPVPEPRQEMAQNEGEVFQSLEDLEHHFRTNFADEAIGEVKTAVVPGDIPGKNLARPLLNLLKSETEKLRRGFPLPLIQELCRGFEKTGLKFFKRGKKALHVSMARPRGISPDLNLTDRILKIVDHIRENPRCKVMDLLVSLVPAHESPPKGETIAEHKLTEEERGVLADIRWLTSEGYLIEFPGTELVLGKQPQQEAKPKNPKKQPARKKKPSQKKSAPPEEKDESKETPAADPDETPPTDDSADGGKCD